MVGKLGNEVFSTQIGLHYAPVLFYGGPLFQNSLPNFHLGFVDTRNEGLLLPGLPLPGFSVAMAKMILIKKKSTNVESTKEKLTTRPIAKSRVPYELQNSQKSKNIYKSLYNQKSL